MKSRLKISVMHIGGISACQKVILHVKNWHLDRPICSEVKMFGGERGSWWLGSQCKCRKSFAKPSINEFFWEMMRCQEMIFRPELMFEKALAFLAVVNRVR
jgi:hypothetical protein